MATPAPPRWDRRMQQRLARGEEAALGELYDRSPRWCTASPTG